MSSTAFAPAPPSRSHRLPPSSRFAPSSPHSRQTQRPAGCLLRRPRRHAGTAVGGRRRCRLPLSATTPTRTGTIRPVPKRIQSDRRAAGDRRFSRRHAGGNHLRRQRDDAGFHVSRALGPEFEARRRGRHHRARPPRQRRPLAGARQRERLQAPCRKMDSDGRTRLERLREKVNASTKLVAVGAASNALGTITDVPRAARLAGSVGACVLSTRCTTPRITWSTCAMDCDFLVCSAYKFYGPHIGALWCRRSYWSRCRSPRCSRHPTRARAGRDRNAQPRGDGRRRRGGRLPGLARQGQSAVAT